MNSASKSRKRYSSQDIEKAIQERLAGSKLTDVCSRYGIPERTVRRKVKQCKEEKQSHIPPPRQGPQPILGVDNENDIKDWIIGMQKEGYPVSRQDILIKANNIYKQMCGITYDIRSCRRLKMGWLNRFLNRYPCLSICSAQIIKRVRNEVGLDGIRHLFSEVAQHVIEQKLTSDRMFNMDESGFNEKRKSKKVVAASGSKNVWSKSIETNSHVTFVACASASGFVIPPLIILQGKRLNRDVMDEMKVPNARVTTSPKGFINESIFYNWLTHFSSNIPEDVKRPVVLIYDGYGSHYNEKIISKSIELGIILVLLPANATHLVQPLDVAVFKPFKTVLKRKIQEFMIDTSNTTILKKDAISIGSAAWIEGIENKRQNIINGFETCGLFPLSYPSMKKRYLNFKDGGANKNFQSPVWLKCRETIRSEILSLPSRVDSKRKRRSTIDVNKRLFSREDLNELVV